MNENKKILKVRLFPHIHEKEKMLGHMLTNRDIARASGVHESTLSAYRNGNVKMVQLETLQKLADFLGCAAGDLLSLRDVSY